MQDRGGGVVQGAGAGAGDIQESERRVGGFGRVVPGGGERGETAAQARFEAFCGAD